MPTCIFVHTHNFILMFVAKGVNLKKPFLLERAANIRQRHILGFRRHELFKF